jgi:hypothetical protein
VNLKALKANILFIKSLQRIIVILFYALRRNKLTAGYVYTTRDRLRAAVRSREKFDCDGELKKIFAAIKNDELDETGFIAKLREILIF